MCVVALVYVCRCAALSIRYIPDYVRCCCVYKSLINIKNQSVEVLDIPTLR